MNNYLVTQIFEQFAIANPGKIAVAEDNKDITYSELNLRANQLARLLERLNKHEEFIVGVFVPSSINLIQSLLAIFKAGGIYLPIDLAFSQKRIQEIFSQTSCTTLVIGENQKVDVELLLNELDLQIQNLIVLKENHEFDFFERIEGVFQRGLEQFNGFENLDKNIQPDDSNYIFYTSGSTGKAKAILGSHKSLTHFILWEIKEFSVSSEFKVSQLVQYTFDASLRDIFTPLCSGGTLCIPPKDLFGNIPKLVKWIDDSGITLLHCVPSLFRLITKELKSQNTGKVRFANLKYILMAGEALYGKDVESWRAVAGEHTELVNLYGATETTMVKTFHRINEIPVDSTEIIHVGKPIDDTFIAIINNNTLCRIGEIGDIYIKTPFATKGYYKDPELTQKVFVQNPLMQQKDIIYKTGDLGRYLKDRSVEVLGRLDEQVKIGGVRVELNEIKQAFLKIKGIDDCVVTANKNADNENELVGYYVGEEVNELLIRENLRRDLNENLIPAYLVKLDELPLTINGKIDKKALPKPEELIFKALEYEEVTNNVEKELETVWKSVLGLEKIGRKASFFSIGGTSLKAFQVISRIYNQLNAEIKIKDFFTNPTIELLGKLIAENTIKEPFEIVPVEVGQEYYEASHAQKRLWVLCQMEGASIAYNMSGTYLFQNGLNIEALDKSFQKIVERHESLRTTFVFQDGDVWQKIHDVTAFPFQIELIDCKRIGLVGAEALANEETKILFDFETQPIFRAKIFQYDQEKYLLSFSTHHIVCDGWSITILLDEIVKLYNAYSKGKEEELKPLKLQYKDFAHWQNGYLSSEKAIEHKNYWLNHFSGELPVLDLPVAFERPNVKTFHGSSVDFKVDKQTNHALRELSSKGNASLFMILLASVKALLYKYTNQTDIIIGSPVAGREQLNLEDQVGFYVNSLALRTQFEKADTFETLIKKVRETTLDAFNHQIYPFDCLVKDLNLRTDATRSPLFDVVVAFHDTVHILKDAAAIEETEVSAFKTEKVISKIDLGFNFVVTDEEIEVIIDYNRDLFLEEQIERMKSHYLNLLKSVLESRNLPINKLSYLAEEEQNEIVYKHNTSRPLLDKTIQAVFEEQVAKTPDLPAIDGEKSILTYQQLNEEANKLAHYLRENYHVQPDDLVGVMVDRSEKMIISILGILKAGAAWLPIDSKYPKERKEYILSDAKVKVLLTESTYMFDLENYNGELFVMDIQWGDLEDKRENPLPVNTSKDLAYVIYTSGSTGHPKGVMMEHHSTVNMCLDQVSEFKTNANDGLLQFASLSFDVSVYEIFIALFSGARLVLIQENQINEGHEFIGYIERKKVSVLILPVSYLNILDKEKLKFIRLMITGGEAPSTKAAVEWSNIFEYYNAYGPTECCVCVSLYRVNQADMKRLAIPIGKPISNTRLYILDENLQPVPTGVKGKLYVAGEGLSRGYLGNEILTQQKYVTCLPNSIPEKRLYDTGDMGKWLEDGNLEYLGRADNQIKIRGYRVELGEIESVLLRKPQINEVTVVAKKVGQAVQYLTAYYTSLELLDEEELRSHLNHHLPTYMVPTYLCRLEKLPLTSRGKVDRNALPDPEELSSNSSHNTPENETEQKLLQIWKEVLKRQQIGTNDNYFALGGDSLKAIQVLVKIDKVFGKSMAIADLYNNPTIKTLSEFVRINTKRSDLEEVLEKGHQVIQNLKKEILDDPTESILLPGEYEDFYPTTPIEEGLIYSSLLYSDQPVYHEQLTYFLEIKELDRFLKVFEMLVHKHHNFKAKFYFRSFRKPIKVILKDIISPITLEDLTLLDSQNQVRRINEYAAMDLQNKFTFEDELLWRIKLFKISEASYYLVWTVHHAIYDGWSNTIFIKEFSQLLNTPIENIKDYIAPSKYSYKDYCAIALGRLSRDDSRNFWKKALEGYTRNRLPFYSKFKNDKPKGLKKIVRKFDDQLLADLESVSAKFNLSFKSICLGAWVYLMNITCSEKDVVTGIVSHDRPGIEGGDQLVGCFLNTLPIRVDFEKQETLLALIKRVDQYLIEAKSHEIHLTEIARSIGEKTSAGNPIFDCILNYIDFFEMAEATENNEVKFKQDIKQEFQQLFVPNDQTNTLLDLEVSKTLGSFFGSLKYANSYFEDEDMDYSLELYERILHAIASDTEGKLSSSRLMTSAEKTNLLYDFNNTIIPYSKEKTLHKLFEEQASKTPDQIALSQDGIKMTYRALNERSNQFAGYLIQKGVKVGDNVGLHTRRNFEMIIAMYGILKAGGAYVPLDPAYPEERQKYIAESSKVRLIVTDDEEWSGQVSGVGIENVYIDQKLLKEYPGENLNIPINSRSLAYTIYTSGSTGKPKGVKIEHHSAVNLVEWVNKEFNIGTADRLLFITSMNFDLSVYDIFGLLASGGSLVIVRQEEVQNIDSLKRLLKEEKITFWDSVPATMSFLVNELRATDFDWKQKALRLVFLSGDWIPVGLPEKIWHNFPNSKVISLGGATEGTVWSNYYPVNEMKEGWTSIPYGKPIDNNFFYILDENRQPVLPGIVGELYIGGVGVAAGYTDELTSLESFMEDPFEKSLGGRMYRTGDLGRIKRDGNMEFIGRKDYQVKIRGFRVELGEIEHCLQSHVKISEVVVDVKEDRLMNKYLCAYIVGEEGLEIQELKEYLSKALPSYMLPAHYMILNALPLTSNGKINRKALPDPEEGNFPKTQFFPPTTTTEIKLAAIWKELLNIDQIGIDDNFMELGAHSLTIGAFINRVHREQDVLLEPREVFIEPTIAGIAQIISKKDIHKYQRIEPISIDASEQPEELESFEEFEL